MATDDRTLILDLIRAALRDVPDGERPDDVAIPRNYHAALRPRPDLDLAAVFAERARLYRAGVTRTNEHGLPATIARLLAERGIGRLVVPPAFPPAHLAHAQECELIRDDPVLPTAMLDAADGVITTACLAIADTGTVVLDAGPGQGRRALTLLPDYHLCVLHAAQIVADVPAAFRQLDPARPLTMISGPSATSDIENNRVEGVHGPRTIDIVIIDRAEMGQQT